MPMIGLTPARLGLLVELVGAEHVAVVGHRDRRHARARRPARSARRAGPRRRAWSTRCARAGGRRSPRSRWSTWVRGAPRGSAGGRAAAATGQAGRWRRRPLGEGRQPTRTGDEPSWQGAPTVRGVAPDAADAPIRGVEALGDDRVHDPGEPVGAELGARAAPSPRRSRARGRRRGSAAALCAWTARVRAARRASRSPSCVVDVVDQAAEERQRVGARPGHPDVRGALLVARAVGALELDEAAARVEARGPGCCSRRPTARSRPGAAP